MNGGLGDFRLGDLAASHHLCAVQELFSAQELQEKFSLDRITKSAAVFDKTKLSWMNGQYLRALPDEEVHTSLKLLLSQKRHFKRQK